MDDYLRSELAYIRARLDQIAHTASVLGAENIPERMRKQESWRAWITGIGSAFVFLSGFGYVILWAIK